MLKKHYLSGIKKFRRKSIFFRNFIVMAIFEFLLVCLLVCLFAYRIKKNITNEIYQMNYKYLDRIAETLDTFLAQIENFSYYLTIDNDMQLLLLNDFESGFAGREEKIKEKIISFHKTFDYVSGVTVYVEGRDALIKSGYYGEVDDEEKWLSLYKKADDRVYLLGTRIPQDGFPVFLTFLHPIRNVGGELLGAIIVDIDLNELNDSLGRGGKDIQSVYMIHEEGHILYANDIMQIKYPERRPELVKQYCESVGENRTILVEAESEILLTVSSDTKDIIYVMYAPNMPYREMSDMFHWFFIISLGAILCSIILSYILARHSYRPIQHILDETVEAGALQDTFVAEGNMKNEIQFITESIQSAKRKNVQLEVEVADWMKRLNSAQVLALQSQINPHFLYNTLDAINWLIFERVKGESTPESDAICSLAQLLRISMNKSSYLVSLKEELTHAMLYVKLMNIRYAGRIQVFWEIPETLQDEKVIRLCLQPILENAISHGFGKRRGRGTIRVSGDIVFDTLILRVIDDGVGLGEDACKELNQELINNYEMADDHVGIRNVNQRIRILFGEKYGVQVAPNQMSGLVVTLGFPASKCST